MKRYTPPLITIGLSLALALCSAALTYSANSDARTSFTTGVFFMQATPSPQTDDKSEMGNTDQIVIMGSVISVIIIVPILMKRKSWR